MRQKRTERQKAKRERIEGAQKEGQGQSRGSGTVWRQGDRRGPDKGN